MNLFQIIFVLFALGQIWSILKRYRTQTLSARASFFWSFIWLLALGVVWWPNKTIIFAHQLGIGRGTDFILYIAVALLFWLSFRLQLKFDALEKNLTKIARTAALTDKKL